MSSTRRVGALGEARRRYDKERKRKMKLGTWRGRVDAEPARNHIRKLQRIWLVSQRAIADAVGVDESTIRNIVEGHPSRQLPLPKRIGADLSDAIRNVTVDDLADNWQVNAIGSTRRLRALSVAGWSLNVVATRGGLDKTGVKAIRLGERTRVTLSVARRIRAVFEQLERLDPLDHMRKSDVGATRNKAAAKGWLPSMAWADAIDDPAIKAWETVRCSVPECIHGSKDERLLCDTHLDRLRERGTLEGLRAKRNRNVLLENLRFILATDPPINPETEEIDRELLAERVGMTDEALERALLRAKITIERLRESA